MTNGENDRERSVGLFTSKDEYVPDDLARAMLRALPDVGAKIGKYLDDAMFAGKVAQVVDPVIPVSQYSSRLKLLLGAGYVAQTRGTSRGRGWQRTPKGKLAALPDE